MDSDVLMGFARARTRLTDLLRGRWFDMLVLGCVRMPAIVFKVEG